MRGRATGLVYMRNRYYSPRLERFLNEDPIGVEGGLNTFAFVSGNPVNGADPFGLCCGIPLAPITIFGYKPPEFTDLPEWAQRMTIEAVMGIVSSMVYGYGPGAESSIALPDTRRRSGTGSGSPTTTGSSQKSPSQHDSEQTRTPQQCFDQSTAPVRDFVAERRDKILASAFAVGVRGAARRLLQVTGAQVRAFQGLRGFGALGSTIGGALLSSAVRGFVIVGGLTTSYFAATSVVCDLAPDWL